jgi:hypothetical protein
MASGTRPGRGPAYAYVAVIAAVSLDSLRTWKSPSKRIATAFAREAGARTMIRVGVSSSVSGSPEPELY